MFVLVLSLQKHQVTQYFYNLLGQTNIIQNMTKMVNAKKGVLSLEQQKLCESM